MLHSRAESATCATVKRIALRSEVALYGGLIPRHVRWYGLQNDGLEVLVSRDLLS